MTLAPGAVPRMPRGVRIRRDRVRDGWVLLAPERAIALDPVGHAILSRIDGHRSFGKLVADLAAAFAAPAEDIARDSGDFIAALAERRILEVDTP
jgi:pyrroloquinoline quinone biosynthesis protein D